ncbi:uncharacterized protein NECHADRAFT_83092 [Fusarium vanettenii 77-13-4]|uniref:Alpha-type protein kinase domain-containing protein n=1 Tax=Fusarium vanettenii (strain ATCC MYA-4622 / CBS 123669 / FGSC 9596 / NRRL 45880 / 77-13-4) TaxID=660122 RepID=C7ZBB9_FUSV7|nr:uncharacterized protein NECHADRAFT_83092 [Fusarium vanettenii 77-13-4]EEU38690.1 hypothetical protein NECHADRAFT_83092 [Fusarium vanettenii 77-13-4]
MEAVSLAANIIQFIVFAKECYVIIGEIRASTKGLTKKDEESLNSTSRGEEILGLISAGMSSLEGELTTTEQQIRDIAGRCQGMASDLREDIASGSVKDRSNLLELASTLVKRKRKRDEVDRKLAEWEELRKHLFRLLIIHISQQQSGVKLALAKLVEQTRQLSIAHSNDLDQMKSDILDAISKESESQEAALDVSTKLFEWTKRVYSLKKEQVILQSLRFDEMVHRRDGIVEAQPRTFEWVEKPQLSFLEWLSKDDSAHHTKTHQKLVQWAAPNILVKASFYFWFSGTPLQKSQEGLLRSLLFQILRQCPSLIRTVCKSRWSSDLGIPWTRSSFSPDGLDEYQDYAGRRGSQEGGVSAHVRDIIEVINFLASLQDIKLCVSRRPWPAFENAFGHASHRKLCVHDENREDIRRYIQEQFTSSPAYQKSLISTKDLGNLSSLIVQDSRGAFSWVALVVESLLQGLENRDRVDELRQRFEETPKTLHAMFDRILGSVEERYHEQAAQILQVASHARATLPVAVYSFIGNGDLSFTDDPKPWDENECLHISEDTESRLKVRCPDLIKIKGTPSAMKTAQQMTGHQVEFLHRTVKDFLSLEETQKMLRDRIKEPFDPMEFTSKALLAHIRGAKNSGHKAWTLSAREMFQLLDEITYYLSELEQLAGSQLEQKAHLQLELLDKLHETITKQTGNSDFLLNGDSFVGVIAQRDMYHYVQKNLPRALHGPGAPLLKSVLFPRWQRPRMQADGLPHPSVKMVELLLKPGDKRRELSKQEKTEIWKQYMTRIYKAREELKSNPELKETHIEIIRMLLEHGADHKIECVVGRKDPRPTVAKARGIGYLDKMKIQSILEEVFEPGERRQVGTEQRDRSEIARNTHLNLIFQRRVVILLFLNPSDEAGHARLCRLRQKPPSVVLHGQLVLQGCRCIAMCELRPRAPVRYSICTTVRQWQIQYFQLGYCFISRASKPLCSRCLPLGSQGGLLFRHSQSQACVLKWFKTGAVFEADYFTLDIKAVDKALDIVNRFNELNMIDKDIKINVPGVWQFSDDSDDEWAGQKHLCEPFIQNYQKFNSNSGWNDDSRAWGEVMQALSHFSYHVSGGQFVLCDLQGGIYQHEIVLSDPVILSRNRDYGVTDLGSEGISSFFSQHSCNNYCRPHWTQPSNPYQYFEPVLGTTMSRHSVPTAYSRFPGTR